MNKQALVDFIRTASEEAKEALLLKDPVVIKEHPGYTWPFGVWTEEGVELDAFPTREIAEQFCKDLDLEVKG